ncbi:MAG: energy transducer TonB [Desulfovibrio sp.]|nr:energy transducer TonB [Desulfovibrio sp.]
MKNYTIEDLPLVERYDKKYRLIYYVILSLILHSCCLAIVYLFIGSLSNNNQGNNNIYSLELSNVVIGKGSQANVKNTGSASQQIEESVDKPKKHESIEHEIHNPHASSESESLENLLDNPEKISPFKRPEIKREKAESKRHAPQAKNNPSRSKNSSHTASPSPTIRDRASSATPSASHDANQGNPSHASGMPTGRNGASAEFVDSRAFGFAEVDTKPSLLNRISPEYPAKAKQKGVSGRVVLKIIIGADGRVEKSSIHSANPTGYFEESVLKISSRLRFSPGKKDGKAVRVIVLIPFDFHLR